MNFLSPISQLTLSAALLGIATIFVIIIPIDPTVLAFYRLFIAAICFAGIIIIKKQSFKLPYRTLFFACLSGFFLGIDLALWNESIYIIGPGIATILNSLQIFVMALLAIIFYKEKITIKLILSLIISFIGIVLLCGEDFKHLSNGLLGVVLGALSAVAFAFALFFLKKSGGKKQESIIIVFYTSIAGAIATASYTIATGESFSVNSLKSVILLLIYGGVFHVLAWIFMVNSIPKIAVSTIGLIMCFEPILAFSVDIFILSKSITLLQYLGSIIAIFAIYLDSQVQSKPIQQ